MLGIDILQQGALLQQERFWVFPLAGFHPCCGLYFKFKFYEAESDRVFIGDFDGVFFLVDLPGAVRAGTQAASVWIEQQAKADPAAVIVYNIRSVVLAQSYYLPDSLYLVPVSSPRQLAEALVQASGALPRIFLVHHYHRSDASLMDQDFGKATGSSRDLSYGVPFIRTISGCMSMKKANALRITSGKYRGRLISMPSGCGLRRIRSGRRFLTSWVILRGCLFWSYSPVPGQ